MKYWKELNELEEAVYQIKVIQSGLNLISESEQFTCYQPSDITQSFQTFVLDLNERMNEAVQKLDEQFNKVWDTVRDDTGRLGVAEEDTTPPWEEDLEAIKSLEEEHEASIRFDKILSNLPTMNTQDNYVVAGAMDDSFSINFDDLKNIDLTFSMDDMSKQHQNR